MLEGSVLEAKYGDYAIYVVDSWLAENNPGEISIRINAISQKKMDTIASYMNDEAREDVHAELAPCRPEEFLRRYLEIDPEFSELLENEFGASILEAVYGK